MIRILSGLLVSFLALCVSAPVQAEMDDRSYSSQLPALDSEQRDRLRLQIQKEIKIEAQRQAERDRRAEEEAQRLAAARAARPYAVRLVEARCTACHGMANIFEADAGWLGWHWIILRMRWINGAKLEPGEQAVLARYLHATHPASTSRVLLEYSATGSFAILATLAFYWAISRARRRRRLDGFHASRTI